LLDVGVTVLDPPPDLPPRGGNQGDHREWRPAFGSRVRFHTPNFWLRWEVVTRRHMSRQLAVDPAPSSGRST
jgi:hypothetical protein